MEVLGLDVQSEHVGQQDVQRAGEILDRAGGKVGRRGKRRPAADLGFGGGHGLGFLDVRGVARLFQGSSARRIFGPAVLRLQHGSGRRISDIPVRP